MATTDIFPPVDEQDCPDGFCPMPTRSPMPVDVVNHPPHYMANGMEAIDVMQNFSSKEEFVGHLRCTAVKYLLRLNAKDSPKVNAEKCRWYVNKLCEVLED